MTSQNFVKNILKNADGTIANIENVGGIIFKTGTPLLANATISTGWISYDQYASSSVIIYSDTVSAISGLKYEYSADAGATILDSIGTTFITLNDFRVAIFPLGKGSHIRISYTNGTTLQTKFYLSVSLSLDMVNSMGSVFTPVNINNIASITKTFLQLPDTNTISGAYDFITRTGNSLNVNVTSTGNSLEVTQLLVKAKTDNLDVLLSTRATESTLSALNTKVTTTVNGIKIDGSSVTQPISAVILPLPTGASTSALQTTGNTNLSSIDTKIPVLGQALATSSVPIVLTASQLTTLTPPVAITGFNLEATQLSIKAKTDNIDVALSTRLKASDTLTAVTTVGAVTSITNALPIGNNIIGKIIITDNINSATIKASSLSATPTDTALVVTLSPNSVTQSTTDASNGSVIGGTSGTKSSLAGSVFNAVSPILTNGQQAGNQSDINGNLKVVVQPSINLIGKVSIDQTTQGTTNFVTNNHTQIAGNVIATNSGINGVGVQRVTIATDNSALASNQTQKLGLPVTVGSGIISTNTERIVLANRVETITGAIESSADIVPTAGQRIKTLLFTNNTVGIIYLQIFNKTSALVLGDVPMNGLVYRIPSNSTLDKTVADFGEAGILYGANTRIGLSLTFGTYTAISSFTNTSINIITVI